MELNQLYNIDCMKGISQLPQIDFILTDPPFPDYHKEKYKYYDGIIDFLNDFKCPQLIFWSAKINFPLNYTAIHIWDKKCGVGSMYERIFERNGGKGYKVYNFYLINSIVAASYTKDTFENHPSQKPLKLIKKLIIEYTDENDIIFDPFMGSGTIAIAAIELGRNWIGFEIDEDYYRDASKRIERHKKRPKGFFKENKLQITKPKGFFDK